MQTAGPPQKAALCLSFPGNVLGTFISAIEQYGMM